MTASSPTQPPTQPQPKAASTTSQTTSPESIDTNLPASARSAVKSRQVRTKQENASSDPASETATVTLIRRILVPDNATTSDSNTTPQIDIENVLPPLTSSNEVDAQLYAILAIVIKDFVNTWYTKITTDSTFVEEVIQIIAHCSRALEQRLRHVDIAELLLNDIPHVLEEHVEAYRIATSHVGRLPYDGRRNHIYHELYPHPALSPVPDKADPNAASLQLQNETTYRQLLVQGALAVLLPTEDLQNAPLRILVGDIIADMILGQALAGKICEGWFLHDALFKVIATVTRKIQPKTSGREIREETKGRLEQFGLLSTEAPAENAHSIRKHQSSVSMWFWRIMQYGYLTILFLRHILVGLHHARTLPKRYRVSKATLASPKTSNMAPSQGLIASQHSLRPVLGYRAFSFVSTILRLAERMPWVTSTALFWQHFLLFGSGRIGCSNSIFDRFLYQTICTYILSPTILPSALLNLRLALFPNNSLGPPAPLPPNLEERVVIKHNAAESILTLLPSSILHTFFNTKNQEEILKQIEEDMLEPFEDIYLNKHMVYRVLDLILVKLLPELQVQGIDELYSDRGITLVDATDYDPDFVQENG